MYYVVDDFGFKWTKGMSDRASAELARKALSASNCFPTFTIVKE